MDAVLTTKLGKFYIQYSAKGLSLLSFVIPSKTLSDERDEAFLNILKKEIDEYAQGKRKNFSIKLDLNGTDFQKKVWKALTQIKYGKVKSYGEVAKEIDLAGGARAIGGANNKNKVPIIIPCHRVIQGDGSLGGYAGGLELKEKLLRIEGVALDK